ncbi:MAG TPA: alpha/beta hydrolase [Candidatus Hydrogenedentes bacterium]|nr:MAG: Alpha/beta hydrolase family protein [Candidatus Hydrogenedentes bacterium ADurb.Bin170]HNZ48438.1 alpha/beta hydrolase [Candidatus Hydrogenedentota bacterium]HOD95727.1 alpha/beta hydrolase [Candidatus Hydrogenedentota bacterium]HOM48852.1 alpha/beta hydrolase [Candidatus Hydrogenedentota bacterium]HOR51121.1 alpha/beta hydrolase [Candidatus Hydrogenedentota bacterium]
MSQPCIYPVELMHRPASLLRIRPKTRGLYHQRMNVVYAEVHGTGLLMDIFAPSGISRGIGVVDVISGGWHSDRAMLHQHIGLGLIDALCERGFTVFAVSPGSVPLFTGQDMVRHIHAAIRHIRQHAVTYGIEETPLGITGVSAGGHLGAMAALTPQKARPDAREPWRQQSTDIQAAACFFFPTDLVDYGGQGFDRLQMDGFNPLELLFAKHEKASIDTELKLRLQALSPALLPIVSPPPFLLIHGKQDMLVPWEQSEKLASALRAAGGEAALLYREEGGHFWPDISVEVDAAADWLEQRLT